MYSTETLYRLCRQVELKGKDVRKFLDDLLDRQAIDRGQWITMVAMFVED